MKKIITYISLLLVMTISGCTIEPESSLPTALPISTIQTLSTEKDLSDFPSIIETSVPSIKNIIPTPVATIAFMATMISEPSSEQQMMINLVMSKLSERMNVPVDKIKLESFETATWLDTSLGCQKTDQNVEDLVVQGYRVKLTVDDLIFIYHTDTLQKIVLCSDDQPFEIYNPP